MVVTVGGRQGLDRPGHALDLIDSFRRPYFDKGGLASPRCELDFFTEGREAGWLREELFWLGDIFVF